MPSSPRTIATAATFLLLASTSVFAQTAVSQPNGKIEIEGGGYTSPFAGQYGAGISFSAPMGDQLGFQVDGAIHNRGNTVTTGGAIHLFARDPDAYLAGAAAGYVVTDAAKLFAIGPEFEVYADQLTVEAWAGWANVDYVSALRTDRSGYFALLDVAYYATDNTRLSVGGGTILNNETVNIAFEQSFVESQMPFSLTGKLSWDEGFGTRATIGFKSYFGVSEKSLIDRHRQDDPRNLGMDLFIGPLPAETEPEYTCRTAEPCND
ncbi:hypothetical protein [Maritalea sp.]|jgi:hypothetical protein|uniref:hypothetical protein n=1 Tax=Maritalea sp. TaxID=2003361 RepID=UPI0039E5C303